MSRDSLDYFLKRTSLLFMVFLSLLPNRADGQEPQIMITGILDVRKELFVVELYALADIPDLSMYGLGVSIDGGGSTSPLFNFNNQNLIAGTYLYVVDREDNFNNFIGGGQNWDIYLYPQLDFTAGNDAVVLYGTQIVPVDVFGEVGVSGSNRPWQYKNGWCHRKNFTTPNNGLFLEENWVCVIDNHPDLINANSHSPYPFKGFTAFHTSASISTYQHISTMETTTGQKTTTQTNDVTTHVTTSPTPAAPTTPSVPTTSATETRTSDQSSTTSDITSADALVVTEVSTINAVATTAIETPIVHQSNDVTTHLTTGTTTTNNPTSTSYSTTTTASSSSSTNPLKGVVSTSATPKSTPSATSISNTVSLSDQTPVGMLRMKESDSDEPVEAAGAATIGIFLLIVLLSLVVFLIGMDVKILWQHARQALKYICHRRK